MSDIAIRVEGLGKEYRIGAQQASYQTLRSTITDAFVAPVRRTRKLLSGQAYGAAGLDETIWALRNVSFEVRHGEVMGIIGRNGAGKSTLLKILSRITEPTEGYADVYGRVGSLLEVGTGFHPELTGRENIYLNGAILGMTREEINRKFDEIVAFAEVEKFIDTPVKHYSSGMGLRLGFAIAAHLEPEILVVDEVLAVGDIQFQRKCLNKMEDVAHQGRTVLFVSHNMAAVQALCLSCCLLDAGQLVMQGDTEQVIAAYLQNSATLMKLVPLADRTDRGGNGAMRFVGIGLYDKDGNPAAVGQTGQHLTIELEYTARETSPRAAVIGLIFSNIHGQRLFSCISRYSHAEPVALGGTGRVMCHIPRLPLVAGRYNIQLWNKIDEDVGDDISGAFSFEVVGGDFFGTGKIYTGSSGDTLFDHHWTFDAQSDR
ncbi:MAG: ABC transporter ATP-binding protein [Anaerolineae bacterium]|nr:ABC transporter ATP-binding protein [Anaerolineae bacterium]